MVTIMSENFAPMRTGTYPRKATMTRILIVEDEESYREPLVYQLTREGYDVSAAACGLYDPLRRLICAVYENYAYLLG